jgi:serine/threonine protein phosphatase 1
LIWPKRVPPPAPQPARLPEGIRIYAIGDVHGHVDLLGQLFAKIEADLTRRPIARPLVVMLGDYIDRGPASRETIDLLIAYGRTHETVFLKGNHETYVFEFAKNPAILQHWQKFGALETLRSYGLKTATFMSDVDLRELSQAWQSAMPPAHLDFFSNLKMTFACGDYFFVHAGVRPGIPLHKQNENDLLWIREDFLESDENFGKLIVHGHTPVPEPDFRPNRINIDTGAYATGRLTCLILEGGSKAVI